jgi:hypothetical protein
MDVGPAHDLIPSALTSRYRSGVSQLPTNPLTGTYRDKLKFEESASVYGGLGLVAIENISAAKDVFFKKQMLIVLHPSRVHPARVRNSSC